MKNKAQVTLQAPTSLHEEKKAASCTGNFSSSDRQHRKATNYAWESDGESDA
jgi:hypothetical protein